MYAIYLAAISVFLIMVQIKRTPMSKGVKASDAVKTTQKPAVLETNITTFRDARHFTTRNIPGKKIDGRCDLRGQLEQEIPGCATRICSYSDAVVFRPHWTLHTVDAAHAICPDAKLDGIWASGSLQPSYGTLSFDYNQDKVRPMIKLYKSSDPMQFLIGVRGTDFTVNNFTSIRFMGGANKVIISTQDMQDNYTFRTIGKVEMTAANGTTQTINSSFRNIKAIKVTEGGWGEWSHDSGYVELINSSNQVILEVQEANKLQHANDGFDRVGLHNRANEAALDITLYRHQNYVEVIANLDSLRMPTFSNEATFEQQVTSFNTNLKNTTNNYKVMYR
jgi:hypothetical protein